MYQDQEFKNYFSVRFRNKSSFEKNKLNIAETVVLHTMIFIVKKTPKHKTKPKQTGSVTFSLREGMKYVRVVTDS